MTVNFLFSKLKEKLSTQRVNVIVMHPIDVEEIEVELHNIEKRPLRSPFDGKLFFIDIEILRSFDVKENEIRFY
jgi:hypothetical protein